jgi:glycosyltransferase involved in cell wall biosynthesis
MVERPSGIRDVTLRVGMLAPVTHPYDPVGYGPWERVTHDLTESLVGMGVEVSLFAASGSVTEAHLVATVPAPQVELPSVDPRLHEEIHIATAMENTVELGLDLVHSHLHVHALVFSKMIEIPLLTTLHGAAWNGAHHPLLLKYRSQAFVSLSESERRFLPELRYVATVPNGIGVDRFPPGAGSGGYLAYVGRMAPEKAPDLAIETARQAGVPLLLAGVIEDTHREYFESLPLGPGVEYLGALSRGEVAALLGDAVALLMPLRWDEPFGLVVVESLACGTPVVAWRRGAMPEIIDDGETGVLVETVAQAVEAVGRIESLSRHLCRSVAEARFSARRMAADYVAVYESLVKAGR